MKPYTDLETTDKYIVREFDQNIDPIELMWHRDKEDRKVTVLEGKGWGFQFDNQLPLELKEGDSIFIPKYQWHRVHKGEGKLILKISKHN